MRNHYCIEVKRCSIWSYRESWASHLLFTYVNFVPVHMYSLWYFIFSNKAFVSQRYTDIETDWTASNMQSNIILLYFYIYAKIVNTSKKKDSNSGNFSGTIQALLRKKEQIKSLFLTQHFLQSSFFSCRLKIFYLYFRLLYI